MPPSIASTPVSIDATRERRKKEVSMTFIRRHPVVSFFVLAYGLSWAYWIPLAVAGVRTAPGSTSTHEPGLLGPALAAFIMTGLTQGTAGVVALAKRLVLISRPTSRFFFYSLSPLIFLGLAIVVAIVMHAPLPAWSEFAIYSGLPPLGLPAVLVLVLFFNGFGEETGWRGFALEPLQRRYGPVAGTLILAALWAGWHTPAFFVVETYDDECSHNHRRVRSGDLRRSDRAVAHAQRTDGSILAAALWHAFYNMTSATAASRGVIAAVTTTSVMVWAIVLLIGEARRKTQHSTLLVASIASTRLEARRSPRASTAAG
jgi:membrane protease YdiL (CAAX protease family)